MDISISENVLRLLQIFSYDRTKFWISLCQFWIGQSHSGGRGGVNQTLRREEWSQDTRAEPNASRIPAGGCGVR